MHYVKIGDYITIPGFSFDVKVEDITMTDLLVMDSDGLLHIYKYWQHSKHWPTPDIPTPLFGCRYDIRQKFPKTFWKYKFYFIKKDEQVFINFFNKNEVYPPVKLPIRFSEKLLEFCEPGLVITESLFILTDRLFNGSVPWEDNDLQIEISKS